MGATTDLIRVFCKLDAGNWIDIITLVVNVCLGVWIAVTFQNNFANKRVLKDHFINEVKDLRDDYKKFFSGIDQINSKHFIPWFKSTNIKATDLLLVISEKYDILDNALNPYQIELRDLITNNPDFIAQFSAASNVVFSDTSKLEFLKFQQRHNYIFNSIIVAINDHK